MAIRTANRGLSRAGRRAEKTALQTWHEIQAALDAAAMHARDVAEGTHTKVSELGRETRRRGATTRDALAGRRPPSRWPWLATVAVIGLCLGAMAHAFGRKAARSMENQSITDPLLNGTLIDELLNAAKE